MPRAVKPKPDATTGPRLVRKTTRSTTPSAPSAIPPDLIAIRAYELFVMQGGAHGKHLEHWLQAEQELLQAQLPRPVKRVAGARAKL